MCAAGPPSLDQGWTVNDLQNRLTAALAPRYAVERELGRGGMATVFLARDLARDRDVALKVLHPDLSMAVGADRFRREIDIAARLDHPHILSLWDSGEAAGSLYYVMPYLRGESLRARIDRERQLPVDESIQLACEVAEALSYAHAQDVVHRDIKPENIMLEDGHAVVADFGIARAVSASGEQKLTQTGVTLGTPTYMSPEQAFAEKAIDGRSDVYSLGCVLFEMLAGQPPFSGPNAQAIMARHTMEQVPSITIVRQTVPDYVEDAIFRALAKSRADRFTTADELIVALRAPGPRTGPRRTQRLGAVERRHRKVRRMVYSAAAAVPLLTAGWAGWHFYLRPSPVGAAPPNAAETTLAVRKVAVLYFDDLSSGATLGPVADGLTEGLIDQLADVKQLDVTSRNGVAPYRGRDVEPDSIARALGVGTLVRGSVELGREGSYQVTVRLVDAATGVDLDRAAFRQPAGSVLALRDSLSSKVAEFLRKRIGNEVELRETRAGTLNVQAWLLAQRAEKLRKQSDSLWQADQAAAAMRNLDAADSAVAAAEVLDPSYDEPTVQRAAIAARRARLSADAEGTVDQSCDGSCRPGSAAQPAPRRSAAGAGRRALHALPPWAREHARRRRRAVGQRGAGSDPGRRIEAGARERVELSQSPVHGEDELDRRETRGPARIRGGRVLERGGRRDLPAVLGFVPARAVHRGSALVPGGTAALPREPELHAVPVRDVGDTSRAPRRPTVVEARRQPRADDARCGA